MGKCLIISRFSSVQIWGLRANNFFSYSFWLILCPLDPHIYADPVTQNVADPTDLDPKHLLIIFLGKPSSP